MAFESNFLLADAAEGVSVAVAGVDQRWLQLCASNTPPVRNQKISHNVRPGLQWTEDSLGSAGQSFSTRSCSAKSGMMYLKRFLCIVSQNRVP